jgi:hypothetical protein
LADIVQTLRLCRNDHCVRRWFVEAQDATGPPPETLLAGAWSPLDNAPRLALELATQQSPGTPQAHHLEIVRGRYTGGERLTLAVVGQLLDLHGLKRLAELTGVTPVVLQRHRNGSIWPGPATFRRFCALAAGEVPEAVVPSSRVGMVDEPPPTRG